MNKIKSINFLQFILLLVPISLTTGPFLPDFFVSVLTVIFLFISIKKKIWKYYNNNYFKFFIILCCYLMVSSLLSDKPLYSLKTSLFYFRFIFFSLATWYIIENSSNNFIKNYTKYFFIFIFFVCLDSIFQFYFKFNFFGFELIEEHRVSGIFRDDLILGSYLARLSLLVFSLSIVFLNFNKYDIPIKICFISLIFFCVLISGERTSLSLIIICITLICLTSINKKIIKIFFTTSLILLSLALILDKSVRYRTIIEPLQQSGILSKEVINNYSDVDRNYVVEKPVIFSREHEAHFKAGILIFSDNLFFGAGPKMFRHVCKDSKYNVDEHSCTTHPHNVFIQILSELGLFGLCFYIMIMYYLIKKFIIIRNKVTLNNLKLVEISCLILFFVNLFPLVPSGNIFNNWMSVIFYIPFGFYLYFSSLSENKK